MRLIDADAFLTDEFEAYMKAQTELAKENADKTIDAARYINQLVHKKIQRLIADAPTIEPKRGEWKWQSSMAGSFIERQYRCSNCQYEITTQREEPIYNFCPMCGADMRGADDEDD